MRRTAAALTLITSLLITGLAIAGQLKDGIAAYERGEYKTAYHLIRPMADKGLPEVQFDLGLIYDNGHGVSQDYNQVVNWYQKAAMQGDANARNNLGVIYQREEGIPQDSYVPPCGTTLQPRSFQTLNSGKRLLRTGNALPQR